MALKITDVMTPIPECCTPDDSVIEVARVMETRDVGVVPIVESLDTRRVVGVMTDRDIVLRVVAQGRDPNEVISVRDVMTSEVVSCSPDADVLHVEELMKTRRIRRIIVVDEGGSVVGIVSMADLARHTSDTQLGDTEKSITR
ncbi:MAG: putative CBS,Cystathionine beta-synthase [bacterium]|nr:putative CBS,Cystathionine beta-synthase [bacterium]